MESEAYSAGQKAIETSPIRGLGLGCQPNLDGATGRPFFRKHPLQPDSVPAALNQVITTQ